MAPALVAFKKVLGLVWTGTDDKGKLNLIFSTGDATVWNEHIKFEVSSRTTSLAPAAAAGPFQVPALAWVATSTFVNTLVGADTMGVDAPLGMTQAHKVSDTVSKNGPALAFFNGSLYLAWTDNDNLVHLAYSKDGVGKDWTPVTTLPAPSGAGSVPTSAFGPALAASDDTLYLAWTGVAATVTQQQLFVFAFSYNATTKKWEWGTQSLVTGHTSRYAPALAFGSITAAATPPPA